MEYRYIVNVIDELIEYRKDLQLTQNLNLESGCITTRFTNISKKTLDFPCVVNSIEAGGWFYMEIKTYTDRIRENTRKTLSFISFSQKIEIPSYLEMNPSDFIEFETVLKFFPDYMMVGVDKYVIDTSVDFILKFNYLKVFHNSITIRAVDISHLIQ